MSSQILPTDSISDMNTVFSSFVQHERQNNLDVIEYPRVIVYAADGRRSRSGPGGNSSCSAGRGRRNSEVCSFSSNNVEADGTVHSETFVATDIEQKKWQILLWRNIKDWYQCLRPAI
ncbi:hypothetical protein TSUD_127960 [Trifolium subterraneum]|nr:hypothetical protein TSUD_127960 [Trifolium subterraneum]